MSYHVSIKIDDPKLQRLLETEYKNLKLKRFKVSMQDDCLHIIAEDAKALKAITFSVVNAAETYEKTKEIVDNG